MGIQAEGWYIDGKPLERLGVVIENRDGWDDTPGVRGENPVLLGRHGESWRPKRFQAGRKSLTVGVHGIVGDFATGFTIPATGTAQRAQYEANLDELLRMIQSPRHRLLSVERVSADGSRRVAECEVINPITPAPDGNTYAAVSFELVVPGVFWRDADEQPTRVPYDLAGPPEQTVEVYSLRGQTGSCSDATVVVTGPCSAVTVADALTGSGFSYGALSSGEILTVDAGAFTAVKGSTTVITDLTLTDGQLLEISPAPSAARGPSLRINATGTSSPFEVVVRSRRSWLR